MAMQPKVRKLALTAHVTSSAGWIGAVVVVLVLGVVGLASQDVDLVRGVYLAMQPIAWYGLVPFSLASLVTGLVMSLGTPWGLFRHYWVVTKLAMNVFASVVLALYTGTLASLAVGARTATAGVGLGGVRDPSPVVHSVLALLLLLVAAVLSVYKPKGLTRYGQRRAAAARPKTAATGEERTGIPDPVTSI